MLVLSQVVLSFGIPFALVPLLMLTSRRDVMGVHVNRRATTIIAWGLVIIISALNVSAGSGWPRDLELIVMPQLGNAKHRIGQRLGSGATTGEGTQNLLCAYGAARVLASLALNATIGLWWADPAVALGIVASPSTKASKPGEAKGAAPRRASTTNASPAATTTAAAEEPPEG